MKTTIFVLLLLSPVCCFAGTFVGQANVLFRVTEGQSTAQKEGPVTVTLTTDYRTIHWSVSFDVDLLISGGPTQPFETRLKARGSLHSHGCMHPTCSLASSPESTPLTFPDTNGRSGAGEFFLSGTAEWALTDRIVSQTRERGSAIRDVVWGGTAFGMSSVYSGSTHAISVKNYPAYVELLPNFIAQSSWKSSTGKWQSDTSFLNLGTLDSPTGSVAVTIHHMTNFSPVLSTIRLYDQQPGDFNSSGLVDAADYVVWRDAPGPLAPLLTSYPAWRSGFGKVSAGVQASAVPEPSSVLTAIFFSSALALGRRRS